MESNVSFLIKGEKWKEACFDWRKEIVCFSFNEWKLVQIEKLPEAMTTELLAIQLKLN